MKVFPSREEVVVAVAVAVETETTVLAVAEATRQTVMASLASTVVVEAIVEEAQDPQVTTTGSAVDPLDLDVMGAEQVILTAMETVDVEEGDAVARTGTAAMKRGSHNLTSSTPLSTRDWTHPGRLTSFGRSFKRRRRLSVSSSKSSLSTSIRT